MLGPVLRHAAPGTATVWVETDRPCTVAILGRTARTFTVGGRHYALVALEDLDPTATLAYDVSLDGRIVRPPAGDWGPPPVLRPAPRDGRARVAVGSCRVPFPSGARARRRYGPDALRALARRVASEPPALWPDLLLLVGDQVYVDHPAAPAARSFSRCADVYRRAWRDPAVGWLLSAVPSTMILDDHDVRDAWNPTTVAEGRPSPRRGRGPGEHARIVAALAAYWVHQHLGNLSPAELRADPLLAAVRAAGDGLALLQEAAEGWARGDGDFAFTRAVGPARLVVADARGRRVRTAEGRAILDDAAWGWLEAGARGDADHLLVVSSVPAYLEPGLHDLEAWGAALVDGAWGRPGRRLGRALTRRFGFEHWPAYGDSRRRLDGLLADVRDGRRGRAPGTVLVLAGEVHHGTLSRLHLPPAAAPDAPPVWQLVSSPLRNALGPRPRALLRVAASRPFRVAMRAVARTAGVRRPAARTERVGPPLFANHVALLELEGRRARVRVEAAHGDALRPELRPVREVVLAP